MSCPSLRDLEQLRLAGGVPLSAENDSRLFNEAFRRVRGVDDVVGKAKAKVAPYRARSRLKRLCRPYHDPHGVDGVVALEDAGDHRAGADERDELAKERLVLVHRVEFMRLFL